jgi:hypothetical protein
VGGWWPSAAVGLLVPVHHIGADPGAVGDLDAVVLRPGTAPEGPRERSTSRPGAEGSLACSGPAGRSPGTGPAPRREQRRSSQTGRSRSPHPGRRRGPSLLRCRRRCHRPGAAPGDAPTWRPCAQGSAHRRRCARDSTRPRGADENYSPWPMRHSPPPGRARAWTVAGQRAVAVSSHGTERRTRSDRWPLARNRILLRSNPGRATPGRGTTGEGRRRPTPSAVRRDLGAGRACSVPICRDRVRHRRHCAHPQPTPGTWRGRPSPLTRRPAGRNRTDRAMNLNVSPPPKLHRPRPSPRSA